MADFKSFSGEKLSPEQVRSLARQYDGIDMAALMGADHNNFPFLITPATGETVIMIWNKPRGMVLHRDTDPVRHHATVEYLREHLYPEFASEAEARTYAGDHDWSLDEL